MHTPVHYTEKAPFWIFLNISSPLHLYSKFMLKNEQWHWLLKKHPMFICASLWPVTSLLLQGSGVSHSQYSPEHRRPSPPTSISPLSVLAPSATCCSYLRMFRVTAQINTDLVVLLVRAVHLLLPSTAHFSPQLCWAKQTTRILSASRNDAAWDVKSASRFLPSYVSSVSDTWTRRTSSIPTHRRLKLQETPSMFIQAVKHSAGPPTSLNYSVEHLTHKALLTTAVQPCMWKQQVLGTGFINVLSLSDVRAFFWWLFWPKDFCFSPP